MIERPNLDQELQKLVFRYWREPWMQRLEVPCNLKLSEVSSPVPARELPPHPISAPRRHGFGPDGIERHRCGRGAAGRPMDDAEYSGPGQAHGANGLRPARDALARHHDGGERVGVTVCRLAIVCLPGGV